MYSYPDPIQRKRSYARYPNKNQSNYPTHHPPPEKVPLFARVVKRRTHFRVNVHACALRSRIVSVTRWCLVLSQTFLFAESMVDSYRDRPP